jgi:hypothetical protein
MPSTTIGFGILLILIGVIGYVYGMGTGHASLTALIPAAFGIALVLLGLFSRMREHLRKHLMHVAVLIGLIGFIITAGRLISKIGDLSMSAAVLSQLAMAIVCLIYVILSIRSFIDARRNR